MTIAAGHNVTRAEPTACRLRRGLAEDLEYKQFVVQGACTTNCLYNGLVQQLIGRNHELADLERAWQQARSGVPQLAVVWGRRRVGKTFLLTHFAAGKRAVYFTATRQDSAERQLFRLTERMREQLGSEVDDLLAGPFRGWEAAFRFLIRLAETDPLLVVIDEAPRLLSSQQDFADLVSAVWENRIRDQRLMLVLTGSAVSVMERMLGAQGGLHRRAALECRLDPFSVREARSFLPSIPAADFITAYSACGGYPLHLDRWDESSSVHDNLRRLAYEPAGILVRDAMDILSEDLDWRGGYERVLAAIGYGARRRSRIAGRAQQRIDYTLDRLWRSGYVRRVVPVGHATADPLYEIADTYLAFWFGVLRDDVDLIEGGQGDAVQRRTEQRLEQHIGRVFESACREHAARLVRDGELPPEMIIGRWWRDEIAEVDVLGMIGDRTALLGECRWQAGPLTNRDLIDLQRKIAYIPDPGDDLTLMFWSRSGTAEQGLPSKVWSAHDVIM
jgi:AAA+ ATPase superfamily predicted ATPase